MYRLGKYNENDTMGTLISENYPVLLVMSRFGIPLGVGDASIGEVCRRNGVDTGTFLAVANLLLDEDQPLVVKDSGVSVEALLAYLHNSHDYFLEFRLPAIRTKLVEAVGTADDLSQAIVRYFDQYVAEVRQHMTYEEKTVFPYVRALITGIRSEGYSIAVFGRQHEQVEARLTEFKQILIKYYPARSTNEINGVLFDIFSCEGDLASHNAVEDRLFVPAIKALERKTGKR